MFKKTRYLSILILFISAVAVAASLTTDVLKLRDGDGNFINIQSPSIAANYTLTLPVDDGTSSQFLQTNGSGTLTWAAASVGNQTVTSITNSDSPYTPSASSQVINANSTSGAITITPPTASGNSGLEYTIKFIGTANSVTIDPNLSETIDAASTYVLYRLHDDLIIYSDGTNWRIKSKYFNPEYLTASSSAFSFTTSGYATGEWAAMTGNSISLTAGSWILNGKIRYTQSTATTTLLSGRWSTANGDNTNSTPTAATLDAGANNTQSRVIAANFDTTDMVMLSSRITVTSTTTIYLNMLAVFSGAGAGDTGEVTIYAERIK